VLKVGEAPSGKNDIEVFAFEITFSPDFPNPGLGQLAKSVVEKPHGFNSHIPRHIPLAIFF
jgi:hypothetical protein